MIHNINIFKSSTTKVTALKLSGKPVPPKTYNNTVVVSLPLTNLKANSILDVRGHITITSEKPFPVLIGHYITLTDSPTSTVGTTIIQKPLGENITKEIHHKVFQPCGVIKVTKDYPKAYINFCMYAASVNYKTGDTVEVEQNGCIWALVFRPT